MKCHTTALITCYVAWQIGDLRSCLSWKCCLLCLSAWLVAGRCSSFSYRPFSWRSAFSQNAEVHLTYFSWGFSLYWQLWENFIKNWRLIKHSLTKSERLSAQICYCCGSQFMSVLILPIAESKLKATSFSGMKRTTVIFGMSNKIYIQRVRMKESICMSYIKKEKLKEENII